MKDYRGPRPRPELEPMPAAQWAMGTGLVAQVPQLNLQGGNDEELLLRLMRAHEWVTTNAASSPPDSQAEADSISFTLNMLRQLIERAPLEVRYDAALASATSEDSGHG